MATRNPVNSPVDMFKYPIIDKVSYISGGAGFLPTGCLSFLYQVVIFRFFSKVAHVVWWAKPLLLQDLVMLYGFNPFDIFHQPWACSPPFP